MEEPRNNQPIQIEDVKKLQLEPGDILVIRIPRQYAAPALERLRQRVCELIPDHKVLVLGSEVDLEILRGSRILQ